MPYQFTPSTQRVPKTAHAKICSWVAKPTIAITRGPFRTPLQNYS